MADFGLGGIIASVIAGAAGGKAVDASPRLRAQADSAACSAAAPAARSAD